MKCKRVRELLPELFRHELDDTDAAALEQHIAACDSCKEAYESMSRAWNLLDAIPDEAPSPALGERFHAMLDGFRESGMPGPIATSAGQEKRSVQLFQLWIPRVAAAVLIAMAAFMVGRESGPKPEMATLRDEVSQLRDMITASLVNQQSAGERLQGLSMTQQLQNPDEPFLSLVVLLLNTDPDVNVRLAAIDALARFRENGWVRGELVESLAAQTSPLIQISLIELLVAMNERQAVGVMKAIADNDNTLDAVKKSARWGIQQMI